MKQIRDTVWQRRGTSWLWDAEALAQVGTASEVWSLRQFAQATGNWPEDLPSNDNNTMVVAGLDGCLDLLTPADAENWLASEMKDAILSFQEFYDGQAALIFWLPSGTGRITSNSATDAVSWRCAHPYSNERIDFGRVLWGEAHEYPQEILLREGAKSSGLFHLRIT
ncbi:hypothetical protein FHW68_005490 [Pseudomonas sp. Tn43]|uniref:hypothetical protein n=1 Tax=Pseudomonas sp. Tn43 TaxID=701213 RepID=UPI001607E827|nr:hypothetical protein [Pseudomonas sp. Tn43]MBB3243905.1 hypothetical protein [Pseudomonas sp. Tn43]